MTESTSLQDCSVTSLQDLLSKIHRLEIEFNKRETGCLELLLQRRHPGWPARPESSLQHSQNGGNGGYGVKTAFAASAQADLR